MATKQDNHFGTFGIGYLVFIIFKSKFVVYVVFDELLLFPWKGGGEGGGGEGGGGEGAHLGESSQ